MQKLTFLLCERETRALSKACIFLTTIKVVLLVFIAYLKNEECHILNKVINE